MNNGPLLFGLLVMLAVVIGFVAVWRLVRTEDPIGARLKEYGLGDGLTISADTEGDPVAQRPPLSLTNRLLNGLGVGPQLATQLAGADLPMTAAEFAMIVIGSGVVGLLIGTLRLGLALGLPLAVLFGYMPILYMRMRQERRQRAFTEQLPDVLTLLVGALRAGHGITQAIETVADQLPPPASTELQRVMRGINLGLSVQQALNDMSERVGTDDLDLVVTAINVQYEMGGNLAQTLEIISETVRDRIRILREIRVMTAQQRLTGYILAALPLALGVMLFLLRPEYMSRLFEPGWVLLLPVAAVIMQVVGFLVIRRIVDIEV